MMTNLLDPCHLLHLREKNKEMTMSQRGSPPFATHEKKKDEDKPPSSLSSSTHKKKKNEDEPLGSSSSSTPKKKKRQ